MSVTVTERKWWTDYFRGKIDEKIETFRTSRADEMGKAQKTAEAAVHKKYGILKEMASLASLDAQKAEARKVIEECELEERAIEDAVAKKCGCWRYNLENFLKPYVDAELAKALPDYGTLVQAKENIDLSVMTATTRPELMVAIRRVATALGVEVPAAG